MTHERILLVAFSLLWYTVIRIGIVVWLWMSGNELYVHEREAIPSFPSESGDRVKLYLSMSKYIHFFLSLLSHAQVTLQDILCIEYNKTFEQVTLVALHNTVIIILHYHCATITHPSKYQCGIATPSALKYH